MKTPFLNKIQLYILNSFLRDAGVSLAILILLFLTFEFFERIDNILEDNGSFLQTIEYFLMRIPLILSLMLPVAMMAGSLLTLGNLSKNSEITAMRASGVSILSLLKPVLLCGLVASIFSVFLNESLVPGAQKRSREIYNLDIKKKDQTGTYNQSNIWFRNGDTFYLIDQFDARAKSLLGVSAFAINESFRVRSRLDALQAKWLKAAIGWNMQEVIDYRFTPGQEVESKKFKAMPLPIIQQPNDFYDVKTDPYSMSFFELRNWLRKQAANGLDIQSYLPYLYEKLSFPIINLVVVLLVAPFAIRSSRAGGMATAIIAALLVGFSYYAVHSFSLAFGRAEILPPAFSAWVANFLLGAVGLILVAGAEAPA
jgi:lipopolysaccharide export system permease protein